MENEIKKVSINKAMLLATIIFMDILGGAEVDLFVPSFPELQSQFGLSLFSVEGLLSVNFLGFCLSLVFIGWLSDFYGHKRVILGGLIVFIIGSMLCVFVDSYKIIMIGRFLQGVGVAAPSALCFLIIADLYSLKHQQYLMAILNGMVNLLTATVGSTITMYYKWKGNFIVLLFLGLITLIMTMLFIPRRQRVTQEKLYSDDNISIFRSKPMLLMIISIVFTFVPYWIFVGISPVLFMDNLGLSLEQYGFFYQGGWALVFALGCILSGPLIQRYDHRKLLYFASKICIVSLVIIITLVYIDSMNPVLIAIAFGIYGISTIIPIMLLYPICINFIPHMQGRVASIIQGLCLMLTAAGLQTGGYFYQGSFQSIGIIISIVILISITTLFFVARSKRIMEFSVE